MKSTPSFCVNPLATNLALYFVTFPCSSRFFLNSHSFPIALRPFGRSTISQVPFSKSEFYFLGLGNPNPRLMDHSEKDEGKRRGGEDPRDLSHEVWNGRMVHYENCRAIVDTLL